MKELKIYTNDDWANDKYFNPAVGQEVEKDIVDYFLYSLPPVFDSRTILQAGEAKGSCYNKETDDYEYTYTTFKKENDKWFYCGNCIKGHCNEIF